MKLDSTIHGKLTDGYPDYRYSGTYSLRVPAGAHTLSWTWQSAAAADSFLLDRLVAVSRQSIPLSEAADASGLTFTPRSQGGWWDGSAYPELGVGGDAIDVQDDGTGTPAALSTTVTGPGVLRWKWKLASPPNSSDRIWRARLDASRSRAPC